jgi:hypothetical protein
LPESEGSNKLNKLPALPITVGRAFFIFLKLLTFGVSYGKLDLLIRFTKEYDGYENSFDRKQLFAGRPKIYFKIAAARGEELYTKNLYRRLLA